MPLDEDCEEMRAEPRKRQTPFRTRSVDLGALRIASIDNVAEALAVADGEAFR